MFTLLFSAALAAEPAATALPEGLLRQLSARDGVACTALGAPDTALRDSLIRLTDPTLQPASVPVRAASCLLELFPADPVTLTTVQPWLADPTRAGLALVVIGHLDAMPAASALSISKAALAVSDPSLAKRYQSRLARSANPEVKALALEAKNAASGAASVAPEK